MAYTSSIHNHCTICDGKDTPEAMVEAAIAAGMTDFGISSHSSGPLFSYGMTIDDETYVRTIRELAQAYRGRIRVHCGVEQDMLSVVQRPELFDYIIGSVHGVNAPDGSLAYIDESLEDLVTAVEGPFEGDALALVEAYFQQEVWQAENLRPDVIGHFDILTLFNDHNRVFDEESRAYRDLALCSLEAVVETGTIVEVNTAGMRKGLGRPYPDIFLLRRLRELKAPIIITVDCHDANRITECVPETVELLKDLGFREALAYRNGAFQEEGLF